MKISIITPVLNEIRVARALDSILSQSHEHQLELIVVDGGSTDGTLEILEGYRDRISTLISEPDDGMYYAMNKGIRHATGDVVGILNSDDQYIGDSVIQDVMAAFEDKETDACYADIINVDNDEEVVSYWKGDRVKLVSRPLNTTLGSCPTLLSSFAEAYMSVTAYSGWIYPSRLTRS